MENKSTQELEIDAYTAILRAFRARSTALTWTKEKLMSELRKELRISAEQHRQVTEELEARQTRGVIVKCCVSKSESGPASDIQITTSFRPPSISAFPPYRKNLKVSQATSLLQVLEPHSSYESNRSQAVRVKVCAAPGAVIARTNSKVSVDSRDPPLGSNENLQHIPLVGVNTPSGKILNCEGSIAYSGRGKDLKNQFLPREVLPVVAEDVLPVIPLAKASDIQFGAYLGQKVKRLWPEDNIVYDAVIVDYDLESGKHALVYDMGSPKESYEWVNLKDVAYGEVTFVEGPPISLLRQKLKPSQPRACGQRRGRNGEDLARGRGKSYSEIPVNALAEGSSPIKCNNTVDCKRRDDPFKLAQACTQSVDEDTNRETVKEALGKTLRKDNLGATGGVMEIDLKSSGCGKTVPDLKEGSTVNVHGFIGDMMEEGDLKDLEIDPRGRKFSRCLKSKHDLNEEEAGEGTSLYVPAKRNSIKEAHVRDQEKNQREEKCSGSGKTLRHLKEPAEGVTTLNVPVIGEFMQAAGVKGAIFNVPTIGDIMEEADVKDPEKDRREGKGFGYRETLPDLNEQAPGGTTPNVLVRDEFLEEVAVKDQEKDMREEKGSRCGKTLPDQKGPAGGSSTVNVCVKGDIMEEADVKNPKKDLKEGKGSGRGLTAPDLDERDRGTIFNVPTIGDIMEEADVKDPEKDLREGKGSGCCNTVHEPTEQARGCPAFNVPVIGDVLIEADLKDLAKDRREGKPFECGKTAPDLDKQARGGITINVDGLEEADVQDLEKHLGERKGFGRGKECT